MYVSYIGIVYVAFIGIVYVGLVVLLMKHDSTNDTGLLCLCGVKGLKKVGYAGG